MQMQQTDVRADQFQHNHDELVAIIDRALPQDGSLQVMDDVVLHRLASPTERVHGVTVPAFCIIAQGSKEVMVGRSCYRYDPAHYLISTIELPAVSRVVSASVQRPYLSMRINLDPAIIGQVMVDAGIGAPNVVNNASALNVCALDEDLLDAAVRLLRLIDNPGQRAVLAPLVKREIVYRLLSGAQGNRLRHLVVLGGYADRVAHAIDWIRRNYDQPMRIDNLAKEIGMSSSGLHHQFKSVTAMTPLQFQKQLRLHEARRLMLGEHMDAASAGYQVGYDDAAHFNREYKRMFGLPPHRDVSQLRQSTNIE